MSSRDAVLASIRSNLPKLDRPLPAVPKFADDPPADLVEAFGKTLTRMGGRMITSDPPGDIRACIRALLEHSRLVCSATPEVKGGLDLASITDPRALADVDHAVVRACRGVVERGSVLLTDRDLKVNALAYLAQHLIVLLDPADIVVNGHSAYARPEFRERHYAAFHSGPSATADIEGVLVLGARGVRSLSVLLVPRNSVEFDQAQGGQDAHGSCHARKPFGPRSRIRSRPWAARFRSWRARPKPFRDFHQLISHGGPLLHSNRAFLRCDDLDFKPLICLARPG